MFEKPQILHNVQGRVKKSTVDNKLNMLTKNKLLFEDMTSIAKTPYLTKNSKCKCL